MDYNIDIKPIAKSKKHFEQWVDVYPFYNNIKKDGMLLFGEEGLYGRKEANFARVCSRDGKTL